MGKKERKKGRKCTVQFGVLIVVNCIFLIAAVILICRIACMEQNYTELKNDVCIIKQYHNTAPESEYIRSIDFLENEMVKYREFIERQQEYLVWLGGLFGVVITGLLTIFEIKGRSDISRIIREKYTDQFEEEMRDFVGGHDEVGFLKACIKKEGRAKQRKLLFLFQNEENKNLEKVYNILRNQGEKFTVDRQVVTDGVTDKELECWTEENAILVYQVHEEEFKTDTFRPDENTTYVRIAKKCNDKKVFCVLYCENNTALERSLYGSYFYANNANYGLTLMERLFNLLYFV